MGEEVLVRILEVAPPLKIGQPSALRCALNQGAGLKQGSPVPFTHNLSRQARNSPTK